MTMRHSPRMLFGSAVREASQSIGISHVVYTVELHSEDMPGPGLGAHPEAVDKMSDEAVPQALRMTSRCGRCPYRERGRAVTSRRVTSLRERMALARGGLLLVHNRW